MNPRQFDDLERIARYLAGECRPEEAAQIQEWIARDPARRRQADILRVALRITAAAPLMGDVDRGWAAISSKLDEPAGPATQNSISSRVLRLEPKDRRRQRWFIAAAAAGIVLALVVGGAATRQFAHWKALARSGPARPVVMRQVSTRRGQQANVYLSDGTHVVLGVASTLRFPTAFGSRRDVYLDGEAYFEVAHDSSHSFVVHMPYGTASDLGTKFAIRAYHDLSTATVTVTEGSVLLQPLATSGKSPAAAATAAEVDSSRGTRSDRVILNAADIARLSSDGRVHVLRGGSTDANLAWMTGSVVFDRTPVRDAVAEMNRWYDADVRLGDSTLARYTLTATLTNEPLPRAIQIVAGALDARVQHRGSAYLLLSRAGRPTPPMH